MGLRIVFYLLFISASSLYSQISELKFQYYKIDEDTAKYAGFSNNYYNRDTKNLDSCVTYRADKVIPDSWDLIIYRYNSDRTVKQILTFHYQGVRIPPYVFRHETPPFPFYHGIIPTLEYSVPWVETLNYNTSGILVRKFEVSRFTESSYFMDNELFYYNENGELNKYTHLASNEGVGSAWDTITLDTVIISIPAKNTKISTTLTWDSADSGWVNKKKNEINTNSVGQQISSVDSVWNTRTETWQGYMKSETEYGSENEILINTLYAYEPMRSNWIGQSKQEYEYDDNGYFKKINYYLFDGFYETWYLDHFCVYCYKERPEIPLNTNVSLVNSGDIQAYPNPVSDYLTIENRSVFKQLNYRIVNINGELLDTGIMINGTKRIDLSLYLPAIYCLLFYSKDMTGLLQTIKIVKPKPGN